MKVMSLAIGGEPSKLVRCLDGWYKIPKTLYDEQVAEILAAREEARDPLITSIHNFQPGDAVWQLEERFGRHVKEFKFIVVDGPIEAVQSGIYGWYWRLAYPRSLQTYSLLVNQYEIRPHGWFEKYPSNPKVSMTDASRMVWDHVYR